MCDPPLLDTAQTRNSREPLVGTVRPTQAFRAHDRNPREPSMKKSGKKLGYGRKLLPYMRPYRLQFGWALAQVFLVAGFDLLKPWPLQIVLDNVLGGKPIIVPALDGLPTTA